VYWPGEAHREERGHVEAEEGIGAVGGIAEAGGERWARERSVLMAGV